MSLAAEPIYLDATAVRLPRVPLCLSGAPRDGDWPHFHAQDISALDATRHLTRLIGLPAWRLWAQTAGEAREVRVFAGDLTTQRIAARVTEGLSALMINTALRQIGREAPTPGGAA